MVRLRELIIPGTEIKISEGSIVTISELPNTKCVLKYGNYIWNDESCEGWYFSATPSNQIIPLESVDTSGITIIHLRPENIMIDPCEKHTAPPIPPCPGTRVCYTTKWENSKSRVKFDAVTYEEYNNLPDKDSNTLYCLTDVGKIYKGYTDLTSNKLSVFDSYENALLYAMTSPEAYLGQIISVSDDRGHSQVYVIESGDTGYTLKLLDSGNGLTWNDI